MPVESRLGLSSSFSAVLPIVERVEDTSPLFPRLTTWRVGGIIYATRCSRTREVQFVGCTGREELGNLLACALAAEVRRLRAERERLAGLLSGIDWRALPDNYKHNLQRAEETAAEALALLEERVDMHRELELENEKLQAENAAIRADVERLRAGEASLRQCIADCIDVWYSDSASDYLGETRWGEKTLAALGMRGLRYDEETGFVEEVTL